MSDRSPSVVRLAATVALGGFLMGFDSAVISGVVDPIRGTFGLDADQLGWAVSCLTLGATLAMAFAGPLADRIGRKPLLMITALLFAVSAAGSALAPTYSLLILARIVGGLGVGAALLIAPVYIAEIAPPARRGQLVSFNQLNIVLGFSAAFFSNFFLNDAGMSWRWMLGVEMVPAVLYFVLLLGVPPSPRWLAAQGRDEEALGVLTSLNGPAVAAQAMVELRESLRKEKSSSRPRVSELFRRRMTRVLLIGLGLGFFQQITGINAIFYYSTTIFGMAGADYDAALGQAIWVGLVNVVFTLLAMRLIDRLGRRPLLMIGTATMAVALFTNAAAFRSATYELTPAGLASVQEGEDGLDPAFAGLLRGLEGQVHEDSFSFVGALRGAAEPAGEEAVAAVAGVEEALLKASLNIHGVLVLAAILLYIAAFAISLGPVMWAMFSEIFPMRLRGLAISAVGFFNSFVSFSVQQLFPRGLESLGPAMVFAIFGGFAVLALVFTVTVVPETKGRTLEELESELVGPA